MVLKSLTSIMKALFRHLTTAWRTGEERGRSPEEQRFMDVCRNWGIDPNASKFRTAEGFVELSTLILQKGKEEGTASGREAAAFAAASLAAVHTVDKEHTGQAVAMLLQALELGRESGTPWGLETAAMAAFGLVDTFEESERPELRDEMALQQAIDLGRTSGTSRGLTVAARASLGLGLHLKQFIDADHVAAWKQAVELGRQSGTSAGLEAAAGAALDIGMEMDSPWSRRQDEASQWYSFAMSLGEQSNTSGGTDIERAALKMEMELGRRLSAGELDPDVTARWRARVNKDLRVYEKATLDAYKLNPGVARELLNSLSPAARELRARLNEEGWDRLIKGS